MEKKEENKANNVETFHTFYIWMTFMCENHRTGYCSLSSFRGNRLHFTARFCDTIPKAFFEATGMGME